MKFAEKKESGVVCIETEKGERLWNEAAGFCEQMKIDAEQLQQKRVEMNYARNAIMLEMERGADLTELLLEKNLLKQRKKNR